MLHSMKYLVAILLLATNVENYGGRWVYEPQTRLEQADSDGTVKGYYKGLQSRLMNTADVSRLSLSKQQPNDTSNVVNEPQRAATLGKETIGNVVFNVHHFTQFLFDGNQVYVYSPKKNDENIHEPQKWTFFYVPVLQPIQTSLTLPWVYVNKIEVRVRLALGTLEVEEAARKAIANQFDNETSAIYSKLWVIAPLMLDSLSAYIVTVGSSLVPGVVPFHIDNPNSNVITFRFVCATEQVALVVAASLLDGDFDIEVSFYFAGMHRVKTNMITITATQLQSILSKTAADGGGTNSTYIHRDQASSFIAKYVNNVKKLIYIEDPNSNMAMLTHGLEEQFTALFQEGINNAKEIKINADAFGQVWQSADLNPDRITSEMSKMFTFNQSETEKHSNSENYYSINQRKDCFLPGHAALDVRIKTLLVDASAKVDHQKKNSEEYEATSHNAVSESEIKKAASQTSIEGAWNGEKFIPKSFQVLNLNDVVDRLQVAVIAKQLSAEKANGAVIRKVSALTSPVGSRNLLTAEMKLYAGLSPPLYPWLLCDGAIVSRLQYSRLFLVIGTKYGEGKDSATFKLPDLRGRVPIGVDIEQFRVNNVTEVGATGGVSGDTGVGGQNRSFPILPPFQAFHYVIYAGE